MEAIKMKRYGKMRFFGIKKMAKDKKTNIMRSLFPLSTANMTAGEDKIRP